MPLHSFLVAGRRAARRNGLTQVGLLAAFWALGGEVARWTGLPIPGGVIGLFIVLALFASRLLNPVYMRRGAGWLLAEMMLFFIPAAPAILEHREFFGLTGLKILAAIIGGTALVMIATALATDLAFRWFAARDASQGGQA